MSDARNVLRKRAVGSGIYESWTFHIPDLAYAKRVYSTGSKLVNPVLDTLPYLEWCHGLTGGRARVEHRALPATTTRYPAADPTAPEPLGPQPYAAARSFFADRAAADAPDAAYDLCDVFMHYWWEVFCRGELMAKVVNANTPSYEWEVWYGADRPLELACRKFDRTGAVDSMYTVTRCTYEEALDALSAPDALDEAFKT